MITSAISEEGIDKTGKKLFYLCGHAFHTHHPTYPSQVCEIFTPPICRGSSLLQAFAQGQLLSEAFPGTVWPPFLAEVDKLLHQTAT